MNPDRPKEKPKSYERFFAWLKRTHANQLDKAKQVRTKPVANTSTNLSN